MGNEDLNSLINAMGDEALAAFSGSPDEKKKALENIHAMARYKADVVAEQDRLRKA